jgi:hypothetical protein
MSGEEEDITNNEFLSVEPKPERKIKEYFNPGYKPASKEMVIRLVVTAKTGEKEESQRPIIVEELRRKLMEVGYMTSSHDVQIVNVVEI